MALAQQAKAKRSGGRVPPHLRQATGADPDGDGIPDRCGTCAHYDGQGMCKLYKYPVRGGQVCDSYRAAKGA